MPLQVADMLRVRGTQPGDHVGDLLVVVEELLACPWLGDRAPEQVLVYARQRVPVPEHLLVRGVRLDNVELGVDQHGGTWGKRAERVADGLGHGGGLGGRAARERL